MLSERVYVYGYTKDGGKEFLHTFLDSRGAKGYAAKHRALFGDRFSSYALWKANKEIEIL